MFLIYRKIEKHKVTFSKFTFFYFSENEIAEL